MPDNDEIVQQFCDELSAAFEGYISDPADTAFQRGYLAALRWAAQIFEVDVPKELDNQ